MSNAENYFRSFAMSGLLLNEELKAVEKKYNISLGHAPTTAAQSSTLYYPQFEQVVRAEASEMARHYEVFYCLEKAIRKLISETMREAKGEDWWDSGVVPGGIVQSVKELIQKEKDSGITPRSDDPIDYTTFGELSVIITSNWPLFETIFSSRRAVEKVMSSLNTIRGPIAHCCPIAEDEIDRLELAVKDWFRMIG
jgi:hypothetical protein